MVNISDLYPTLTLQNLKEGEHFDKPDVSLRPRWHMVNILDFYPNLTLERWKWVNILTILALLCDSAEEGWTFYIFIQMFTGVRIPHI